MHTGMAAAKAQSLFRGLMLVDADAEADRAALERITLWALTIYSPIVAVDGIDGIVMDTEGADHLQGGELSMVNGIANRFLAKKLTARVAVADSLGCCPCLRPRHQSRNDCRSTGGDGPCRRKTADLAFAPAVKDRL